MKILLLLPLLLMGLVSVGQNIITEKQQTNNNIFSLLDTLNARGGGVHFYGDLNANLLVDMHKMTNAKRRKVRGWRIQIYSSPAGTGSSAKCDEIRERCRENFPDMPVYIRYVETDFKIRVGNFHSRLEAIPALKRLKREYRDCYPVKDDIDLSDFDKSVKEEVIEHEDGEAL